MVCHRMCEFTFREHGDRRGKSGLPAKSATTPLKHGQKRKTAIVLASLTVKKPNSSIRRLSLRRKRSWELHHRSPRTRNDDRTRQRHTHHGRAQRRHVSVLTCRSSPQLPSRAGGIPTQLKPVATPVVPSEMLSVMGHRGGPFTGSWPRWIFLSISRFVAASQC